MNRPDIFLDQLWRLGDRNLVVLPAGKAPDGVAVDDHPPRIVLSAIEGAMRLPAPGVLWAVTVPNPR